MKCWNCGQNNFAWAKKCDHCSQSLSNAVASPANDPESATPKQTDEKVDGVRDVEANDPYFGPFAAICMSGGYLDLLGMRSADVLGVLGSIVVILDSTPHGSLYVERLLHDRNWRGHMVGLTAALVSRECSRYAPALWTAFDRGSWVAPQLAVALHCCDPAFPAQARGRIVARCPLSPADERYFLGQTHDVSAKNLASLLRVLSYVPSESSWTASELRALDVQKLLESDVDSAGKIVEWWFDAARARFREFGRNLIAAAS